MVSVLYLRVSYRTTMLTHAHPSLVLVSSSFLPYLPLSPYPPISPALYHRPSLASRLSQQCRSHNSRFVSRSMALPQIILSYPIGHTSFAELTYTSTHPFALTLHLWVLYSEPSRYFLSISHVMSPL